MTSSSPHIVVVDVIDISTSGPSRSCTETGVDVNVTVAAGRVSFGILYPIFDRRSVGWVGRLASLVDKSDVAWPEVCAAPGDGYGRLRGQLGVFFIL